MAGISKKGTKGFQSVEEGSVHTGTEAWNIAQYYTGYSIALPLKDLNELEDIARFGSVRIDDEIMMSDDLVDKRRADAVKRYWQKIKQIILDTMFKVKKKDREEAEGIFNWIKDVVPKYFDKLLIAEVDEVAHDDKIKINEELLTNLLNALVERKKQYLYILDKTGLIFREIDEVDLDKLTSEFENGG